MELKEIKYTGVIIKNLGDLIEYFTLCEAAGWVSAGGKKPLDVVDVYRKEIPTTIGTANRFGYAKSGHRQNEITLAEFKKEQGIMKYKQGDVLVYRDHEVKVLGVCGEVYFISAENDFNNADNDIYTEGWLDDYGYTLKTDTPTKTDTMIEVDGKYYSESTIKAAMQDYVK